MASLEHLEDRVLQLELSNTQVRGDLYGRQGTDEPGLVREYREDQAERRGRKKMFNALVAVVGLVQVALGIIIGAEHLKALLK